MTFLEKSKCDVYTESIEVIFRNNEEIYKYKLDVFVMCENATRQGESLTSSLKIIFEIISKSTTTHDYITKLDVYQRFGVLEYNIVEQDRYIVQLFLFTSSKLFFTRYIISMYKNFSVD